MAGTIFGIPLSQRMSANGLPLAGWKINFYEANTSTPVNTYEDYGLTAALVNPWPLVADSAGVMPIFWLADGSYRVRATDASGNELFDEATITALGPSSGAAGGGSSVDSNKLFATGDFLWQPIAGTRTGWVRANARTVGSAASGGTERSNADVESLFLHLWANYSNTLCPVLPGGRGASAAADWSANKTIGTLDMRSRAILGLDDMANSAAGVTGGSTTAAASVGASTYTITQGMLPNVSLSSTGLTVTVSSGLSVVTGAISEAVSNSGGGGTAIKSSISSLTVLAATLAGTIPLGGSGTQMAILTPARAGTWFIKL